MKSSFRSVRVALIVVGAIGAAALVNGCSAGPEGSEQTGEGNQDFTKIPIQQIHNLASETGPADPSANNYCASTTVSPPPSLLAQYNCTLGDLYGTPTSNPLNATWSYAFACEAGITSVLPKSLGLPIPSELTLIPSNEPIDDLVSWEVTAKNSCFGNADTGWVIVVDTFFHVPITGGCVGTACDNGNLPGNPVKGHPIQ